VLDSSYPKLTNSIFRDWSGSGTLTLPDNLDTILYLPETGITFFFKGYLYWRSSKLFELEEGYPRFISESFVGLNTENGFLGKLDASFIWGGNNQAYFVEGRNYWRFSFETGRIESDYPKDITVWKGLPEKITDALLWTNGVTYFFVDDKYYRFNDDQFSVENILSIYPRFNLKTWFDCVDSGVGKLGQLIYQEPQAYNITHNRSALLDILKKNNRRQLANGSKKDFCCFNSNCFFVLLSFFVCVFF